MTIPELEAKRADRTLPEWEQRQADDELHGAKYLLAQHALAGFMALRKLIAESEKEMRQMCPYILLREATDAEVTESFAGYRAALAPVEHLLPKE